MILLGVGLGVLAVVLVGLSVARKVEGDKLLTIGDFYRRRYGRGVEALACPPTAPAVASMTAPVSAPAEAPDPA